VDKQKLIHQLFVGKVADEIGFQKTMKLLAEATKAFEKEPQCKHEKYRPSPSGEFWVCASCGKQMSN
jgi:ribosomal protein L37AE/L43A